MKPFTLFIVTYRNPSDNNGKLLIKRCLESVFEYFPREKCNIFVGCNEVAPTTADELRELYNEGAIDLLVVSKDNICKEGMAQIFMQYVDTPYIIFIDDDTHFHGDVLTEIEEEIAYDTEGIVAEWGRVAGFVPVGKVTQQSTFGTSIGIEDVRKQAWFTGKPLYGVQAIAGGFAVARTEALKQVDYPSNEFAIYAEDIILGMGLYQQGWAVRNAPVFWDRDKVSFGDERGVGSRTERGKPRKIWNGEMEGIEVNGITTVEIKDAAGQIYKRFYNAKNEPIAELRLVE